MAKRDPWKWFALATTVAAWAGIIVAVISFSFSLRHSANISTSLSTVQAEQRDLSEVSEVILARLDDLELSGIQEKLLAETAEYYLGTWIESAVKLDYVDVLAASRKYIVSGAGVTLLRVVDPGQELCQTLAKTKDQQEDPDVADIILKGVPLVDWRDNLRGHNRETRQVIPLTVVLGILAAFLIGAD